VIITLQAAGSYPGCKNSVPIVNSPLSGDPT